MSENNTARETEEQIASGGESMEIKNPLDKEELIREELMTVIDPEMGIDVINLGLIYKIELDEKGHAEIDMTLTSMGCPLGPQFQLMVKHAAMRVDGVESANVNIVFSPPWDPREMASEDAKIMLGIF